MTRDQIYHIFKALLCKHGLVPSTEKDYENLIQDLLNIYFKKSDSYSIRDPNGFSI